MKKTSLVLLITTILLMGNIVLNATTYTVTNTGDAGVGSLRQAILNANANPGADIIDFNIPLVDAGYNNWTGTADSWWKITLLSNLPDISEDLTIDGFSQSINVSDSNVGVVGTGGTVGVDEIPLPQYEKPEIEIDANDLSEPLRIAVSTNNVLIEAISIFNALGDAILTRGNSMGIVIQKCFVGSRADGSEPMVDFTNDAAGIRIHWSAGMYYNIALINECYLAYNGNSGVIGSRNLETVPTPPYIGATITVEYCEVFENGWNSDSQDGIDGNGANNIIRYNLSYNNRSTEHVFGAGSGAGIELGGYTDLGEYTNNIISNNTCYGNDNHGIVLMWRPSGDLVSKNVIRNNNGPGILVTNRHYYNPLYGQHTYTRNNKIFENSIYDNAGLGIDLCNVEVNNYINGDEVTFNDGIMIDINANEGIDFPVIAVASIDGNLLSLEGYVGSAPNQALFANNTVEFYISSFDGLTNPNPAVSNDSYPYHGEGKTFLGTLSTDANGNFNDIIDVTGFGITSNTWLTSTATDLFNNTSEFSENIQPESELPVTLSSFNAVYASAGFVSLSWTTQSESNNLGWNVYRSLSENIGQANQMNNVLIPGYGTTSEPTDYIFTDENEVENNTSYWYWIESTSYSGETEIFGPVTLTIQIEDNQAPDLPTESVLQGNYPNPFNPNTMISFSIQDGENGSLTIYNTRGQLLETHEYEAGDHQLNWDAAKYGSGIYFYKLETQNYTKIKKMIMVK